MSARRRRLASALLVVAVLFAGAVAPIAAAIPGDWGRAHLRLGYHPRHWSGDPRLAPLATELFRRGYLVPDAAVYERAKARAARRIQATRVSRDEKAPSRTPLPPNTPSATRSWEGTFDPRSTPSDSTGAIGPTRYIELVNTKFAIYDRASDTPLATGGLETLTGDPFLTDPQVIWDPTTERFYFLALNFDVVTNHPDGIDYEFGFSLGPEPNGPSDFCGYSASYGYDDPASGTAQLPDQPHLGDSQGFVFWGVNVFDKTRFVGADVDWVTKPTGTGQLSSCPDATTFKLGSQAGLLTASGRRAWTPVGVNQTDTDSTGWVIASELPDRKGNGSGISVFAVTPNLDGTASVQATGAEIPTPEYGIPPPAPQAGTGVRLDTLDGRLLQAVSAIDPSIGTLAIWTEHAVAGGGGSEVRWYEVTPSGPPLLRSGVVSSSSLFVYNAAISPDRAVSGGTGVFGDTMVLTFTTSSAYTDASIWTVSKSGDDPQSAWVLVKQSPGPAVDDSCFPTCRWGDYPGASPDPVADVGATHGQVWFTSMWNARSGTDRNFDWRTWNWAVGEVPTSSDCTMIGMEHGDVLSGTSGNDVLCGNGGNDVLLPGRGNDTVDGGDGRDLVDYGIAGARVVVDLARQRATGQGTDTLTGIESAIGTHGPDTLFGSAAANRLFGLGGNDRISGAGGNDFLNGGPGADVLHGGPGRDRCVSGGGPGSDRACER